MSGDRSPAGKDTHSKLISADSHVAVSLDAVRERVPRSLHEAFDDAIAAQARVDADLRGGKQLSLESWDMEAMRDPGYRDPVARLAAMDRDGVHAEVLYSEVSAFRAYGLVPGDWRPISRAFTDLLVRLRGDRPRSPGRVLPSTDHRRPLRRRRGRAARRRSAPGRCTCRTGRASSGLPDYHERVYDPLWARAAGDGPPSATTSGTGRRLYDVFRRDPTPQMAIFTSLPALALSESSPGGSSPAPSSASPGCRSCSWSRVCTGSRASWPSSTARPTAATTSPGCRMKPSEYFRRNMACTFIDDKVGLRIAPPHRRREHPVVDRLPAPGDHVAALPGDRRAPIRRRRPGRARPHRAAATPPASTTCSPRRAPAAASERTAAATPRTRRSRVTRSLRTSAMLDAITWPTR